MYTLPEGSTVTPLGIIGPPYEPHCEE